MLGPAPLFLVLESMGYEVEAAHHEVAPGQHEIDFKYADAVKTADNIITFRFVVKKVALSHGLHATFMPKPLSDVNGSGMHMNMSLFTLSGENAFDDPEGEDGLSPSARGFIAVLLAAGLVGIEKGLDCGGPVNENIFMMSKREKSRGKVSGEVLNLMWY